MLLLWELGHRTYGDLVLPGVIETARTLFAMTLQGRVIPALLATAFHALLGWFVGMAVGILAGGLAGWRTEIKWSLQPVAVILLGVPVIAWVVLALLWFGGSLAVIFTVAIATGPIAFAAATRGVRSVDGSLAMMARSFEVPRRAMILDVYGPHMLSYLMPALATTLAMSWKISVMAELLSGAGGIGDGIAAARAQVDTAQTMAWVLVIVLVLILIDHLGLRPLANRLDHWREEKT